MEQGIKFRGGFTDTIRKNHHPTVKPTELMRYLCRLVTPPGGTILDPFVGSGSTGKAAKMEGFSFVESKEKKNIVKSQKKELNLLRGI